MMNTNVYEIECDCGVAIIYMYVYEVYDGTAHGLSNSITLSGILFILI